MYYSRTKHTNLGALFIQNEMQHHTHTQLINNTIDLHPRKGTNYNSPREAVPGWCVGATILK